MANFKRCIDEAVKLGKIKPGKGFEAKEAWDAAYDEARKTLSETAALDAADLAAVNRITKGNLAKKWARVHDIRKQAAIVIRFGKTNTPDQELINLFDEIDNAKRRVHSQAERMFEENLEQYRPRYAGLYHPTRSMDNVIDEIYGIDTGDASARIMATEVKNVNEWLRKRANMEGASIAENPNGRPSVQHDRTKLRKRIKALGSTEAAREEWVRDHVDAVDWTVFRYEGDEVPLSRREEILEEIYDAFITKGNNKRAKGFIEGALVNKLNHEKVLYYKDAESWKRLNGKYGSGNLFQQMVSHMELMSRDIAMLEKLGTNPASSLNQLTKAGGVAKFRAAQIDKRGKGAKRSMLARVNKEAGYFVERYRLHNHLVNNGDESTVAQIGATARTLTMTAVLSRAFIANLGDVGFAKHTLMVNRIPSVGYTRRLTRTFMELPIEQRRREATRAGILAENATDMALSMQRYLGPLEGAHTARLISDVIFRAQLLTPLTQAGRVTWSQHLMGAMADAKGTPFANLPWRSSFEEHGITAADWDLFRKVKTYDDRGSALLRPVDLLDAKGVPEGTAQRVSDKFFDWMLDLGRRAVPAADTRVLAVVGSSRDADTLQGQVMRLFSAVKAFPAAINLIHMRDAMAAPTPRGKASNVAKFVLALTLSGAFITQMKELAAGRDPRDMTDPLFWGRALLNGGSLGFLGDALFNNINAYRGGGLSEVIAGPVTEAWTAARNLTIGNALEALHGDKTNFPKELLNFSERYLPVPWEVKLALERFMFDAIMREVDPKTYRRQIQRERQRRRDLNQRSWWETGDVAPERAPDLRAIIGGSR